VPSWRWHLRRDGCEKWVINEEDSHVLHKTSIISRKNNYLTADIMFLCCCTKMWHQKGVLWSNASPVADHCQKQTKKTLVTEKWHSVCVAQWWRWHSATLKIWQNWNEMTVNGASQCTQWAQQEQQQSCWREKTNLHSNYAFMKQDI
jgi:hypothetical protein